MNTRRCVLSGQRTLLSLLVFFFFFLSSQESGSLVAMATVGRRGVVVFPMIKFGQGLRNCGQRASQRRSSISILNMSPSLSGQMRFRAAIHQQHIVDILRGCPPQKDKSCYLHGLLHETDLTRARGLEWEFMPIIFDLPSSLCRVMIVV